MKGSSTVREDKEKNNVLPCLGTVKLYSPCFGLMHVY
jgi:hypothetical protein